MSSYPTGTKKDLCPPWLTSMFTTYLVRSTQPCTSNLQAEEVQGPAPGEAPYRSPVFSLQG